MDVSADFLDVNTLILRVRAGDQQAFRILLDRYQPLIDKLVSKFESDELTKSFEEDLLQEATLVFYNAIMAYDEKQSDDFISQCSETAKQFNGTILYKTSYKCYIKKGDDIILIER